MKKGIVVIGKGAAGRAAAGWLRSEGALAGWVAASQVVRLVPGARGGWCVMGEGWQQAAPGVLLAGRGLGLWRAAGGAVVLNPAIGAWVPVPGGLAGIEVAGAALGVRGGTRALAKSGRFRARALWRRMAAPEPGAGQGAGQDAGLARRGGHI